MRTASEGERLLRFKDILILTGLSRSTIGRLERQNLFPSRRQLGSRSVGWMEREVIEWIHSRETKLSGNLEAVEEVESLRR